MAHHSELEELGELCLKVTEMQLLGLYWWHQYNRRNEHVKAISSVFRKRGFKSPRSTQLQYRDAKQLVDSIKEKE